MVYKPAHKQDDPAKRPGQIRTEISLRDYYQRKGYVNDNTSTNSEPVFRPKKLSFDEWYLQQGLQYDLSVKAKMMDCWKIAQENV